MKIIFIFFSLFFSAISIAATDTPIVLEKAHIHLKDKKAIERGAKFFAQHCMVCHSVKYLTHDKIAEKAGITLDKMPLKEQEWWFGTPPPDLTLVARVRGTDWLLTYLHSFYQDKTNRLGSNNLLTQNTSMPNPFIALQGEQELIVDKNKLFAEKLGSDLHYFSVLKRKTQGQLTTEQFDQTINDVVSFLSYAAEPHRLEREKMGKWVIGFLILLAVFAYLLKRVYWHEVGREKD